MERSVTDSTEIKRLLKDALTDKVDDFGNYNYSIISKQFLRLSGDFRKGISRPVPM